MKNIKDADIKEGLKVLIRADLDVPLKDGQIQDTYRLEQSLETIKYVISKGARPVICGHLGRPKGQITTELSTNILRPFYDDALGQKNYEILENLRFNPGEEKNTEEFCKYLAEQADMYVNDAFATSTREHASITGITKLLPSYAGLQLVKEVETLGNILKNADRPLVSIIGGAKIESKKPVIVNLSKISDYVLVGGRLGIEADQSEYTENVIFPTDYASDQKDIGKETIEKFKQHILQAKTIIWAGPLGLFEEKEFETGTLEIGNAVIESKAYSVIGGGDTLEAAKNFGFRDKINFVSCGGSAMLHFISGKELPGLKALNYD